MSDRIPLYTSLPPNLARRAAGRDVGPSYLAECITSWRKADFDIISLNSEDDLRALSGHSYNIDYRPAADDRPKISDFLRDIRSSGAPLAGIINADVLLSDDTTALQVVLQHATNGIIALERTNIDPIKLKTTNISCCGFDCFIFKTEPLSLIDLDVDFAMGHPWWDYWLPLTYVAAGSNFMIAEASFLFHLDHAVSWTPKIFNSNSKSFIDYFFKHPGQIPGDFLVEISRVARTDISEDDLRSFSLWCFQRLRRLAEFIPIGASGNEAALLNALLAIIPDRGVLGELKIARTQLIALAETGFNSLARLPTAKTKKIYLPARRTHRTDGMETFNHPNMLQSEFEINEDMRKREGNFLLGKSFLHGGELASCDGLGCRVSTEPPDSPPRRLPRVLLIKRWGCGFWSDVDHVVGQLAAAEILGRVPIVQWGTAGPYGNGRDETFTLYFEPVSDLKAEDLGGCSIWPPVWARRNIDDQLPFDPVRPVDPSYRTYELGFEKQKLKPNEYGTFDGMVGREEDVVVSIMWENPAIIAAAAGPGSRFCGMAVDEVRRTFVMDRLRLRPAVAEKIDGFWREHLAGHPTLAVHARGSDKITENPKIHEQNAIALQIAREWPGKIFLLTDSLRYLTEWKQMLGERLVVQDCLRTSSEYVPNFLLPCSNGYRNGTEILIDTYVAARCDRFVGNYSSNIGRFVLALGGHTADRVTFVDLQLLRGCHALTHVHKKGPDCCTPGSVAIKDEAVDFSLSRVRDLEEQVKQLEGQVRSLREAYSRSRHQFRRRWLRPPLWTFEQYAPRPLTVSASYADQQVSANPPVIAIVTPSLNYRQYLKETIDSVLSQNYPRLIYRVQDGGSGDGTVKLLTGYGAQLSWRSESDGGQAQAINRAFAGVDCEIMAYLNSDDMLLPGTLAYVASVFADRPDIDVIYGNRIFIDWEGKEIGRAVLPKHDARALRWADYVPQETMFWRRRVWDAIGPLDESFDYALDWDFILRAQTAGFRFFRAPRFLACFRVHDEQKTAKNYDIGRQEMQRLRDRYIGRQPSHSEIMRAMFPYLSRQLVLHWIYKWGMLRL